MRLALVGSALPGSGFGRVLKETAQALSTEQEVYWIGLGNKQPARTENGYSLLPCNLYGGDVFGTGAMEQLHTEVDLDAAILLNDFWMLQPWNDALKAGLSAPPLSAWIPIDGSVYDYASLDHLQAFESVVPFTMFGQQQFASMSNVRDPIGHGLSLQDFYPLADQQRREARKEFIPEIREDALVVLNANRPVPRKNMDITLRAFALAHAQDSRFHLVLHAALCSASEKAALTQWVEELSLSSCVTFSQKRLSTTDLNRLYNACDIGINTASGEGWGLVGFEHAATGAAQIVPDNSVHGELWGDAPECIRQTHPERPDYTFLEMKKPDADDAARALLRLADDSHRQSIAQQCQRQARDQQVSWRDIAAQWTSQLQKVNE